MRHSWANEAIFYHVYPLGALGAPLENDLRSAPVNRLEGLWAYTDHWKRLGINALYLGPLFESSSHGYDTADYFQVDRRLGDNQSLRSLVQELHRLGFRVVLDGVFHHVGRDFWAFRDLLQNGESSQYKSWFSGVRFGVRSPYGDPFQYDTWDGHYSLVKLNVDHPEVLEHLLGAVSRWIEDFAIDGLRLDVAESLSLGFLQKLSSMTRRLRPDFWLMGEMIHGDYTRLISPALLHSTTNYECYKGLWSSLNDKNYFEIAHSLQRQFGAGGVYRDLSLYSFVDNHDVTRAASNLKEPGHLYPLYLLLFTMPGVPSIYYGSEWGFLGEKSRSDTALRPPLPPAGALGELPHQGLAQAIGRFSALRKASRALREGSYREVKVRPERFAFLRTLQEETILVVLNAAPHNDQFEVPGVGDGIWLDLLHPGERFESKGGKLSLPLSPCWGRVLRLAR